MTRAPSSVPTLVVGVGTGRCGTKSLVRLLDVQPETAVTHERFGASVRWNCNPNLWPLRLWRFPAQQAEEAFTGGETSLRLAGDVSLQWTPHVRHFLRWADNSGREVRIIGLRRDREEVVDSYLRWKPNADHWRPRGVHSEDFDEWDKCYPAFPEAETKAEGIGRFWDRTYEILDGIEDPRLKVFPTEALNSEEGVRAILEHVGVTDPKLEVGLRIKAPSIEDARNSTQWE